MFNKSWHKIVCNNNTSISCFSNNNYFRAHAVGWGFTSTNFTLHTLISKFKNTFLKILQSVRN